MGRLRCAIWRGKWEMMHGHGERHYVVVMFAGKCGFAPVFMDHEVSQFANDMGIEDVQRRVAVDGATE